MSKPVRNSTSSFSLNIFNKIDTVSECAWVSVTNIPEGSSHKEQKVILIVWRLWRPAWGYRLNSWWWLVSWSMGSYGCVLTWLTEQWDTSGLLYRVTSFVPKGSVLMMSPNVLPSEVSFQQVSWGRDYDSAVNGAWFKQFLYSVILLLPLGSFRLSGHFYWRTVWHRSCQSYRLVIHPSKYPTASLETAWHVLCGYWDAPLNVGEVIGKGYMVWSLYEFIDVLINISLNISIKWANAL